MNHTSLRRSIAALLAALIAVGPGYGFAQNETVEPNEAQKDYNDRGVILIQDGKYREAIASFRSSLSIGELNITYLNLGRAYFRLDRCLEAREAYDAIAGAPKVQSPSPSEIQEILQRFEADYSASCSATIAISCEGDPELSVDDLPARSCSEVSAWPVTPGKHTVVATYDTGEVEEEVDVKARAAATVSFEKPEAVVETDPEPDIIAKPGPEPEPPEASTPAYVWITLGSGAAIIAGALAYDLAVIGPKLDDLEDLEDSIDGADVERSEDLRDEIDLDQTITIVGFGVGGAALLTGAVLWLLSGDSDNASASIWVTDDSAGLVWGGTF